MKKSIFSKVGAAAMVLTLVTASLVGGTFAKYTSTVEGTAKAKVAAWNVAFSSGQTDFAAVKDISLVTADAKGRADGKILPGEKGTIEFKVDGSKSDVGFTYKIKIAAPDNETLPVKFYTDQNYATELPAEGVDGIVYYSATEEMIDTPKIYWILPDTYGANQNTVEALECVYKVTLTADQSTAEKPVSP